MAGGRPTKYKARYCKDVIGAAQEGLSLTAFAGMIGVCRDTISEWMNVYPEFSAATRMHAAVRTLTLERSMLTTEIGARASCLQFALKNAAPHEFKDKQHIDAKMTLTLADLVAGSYKAETES